MPSLLLAFILLILTLTLLSNLLYFPRLRVGRQPWRVRPL